MITPERASFPVTLAAAVGLVLLAAPLVALVVRAPWHELDRLVADDAVTAAVRLSVGTSLAATLLATITGIPLARLLARGAFPGRGPLRSLVLLPMVLPPVVAGVALLLAFGRRGLVGAPLADLTGVTVPFTTVAVVLAQAFVALPFLVVVVEAGLRSADHRLEDVAATLGATRARVWWRVTLPSIAPAVVGGVALAWARALGEFGATITFAGNLPGRTQTIPSAVYLLLETDPGAATLLSVVLLAISLVVLASLRGRLVGAR